MVRDSVEGKPSGNPSQSRPGPEGTPRPACPHSPGAPSLHPRPRTPCQPPGPSAPTPAPLLEQARSPPPHRPARPRHGPCWGRPTHRPTSRPGRGLVGEAGPAGLCPGQAPPWPALGPSSIAHCPSTYLCSVQLPLTKAGLTALTVLFNYLFLL